MHDKYESELLAEISAQLGQVFKQLAQHGQSHTKLGDPRIVAERMINSIPKTSSLNAELGPFFTTSSLTKWLCVSRQYIYELTKQKRILSFTTADGHLLYPAFQFGLRGAYMPELPRVIAELEPHLDQRSIILWLVTPQPDLADNTPADWLKAGKDPESVIGAAEGYMSYFASELVGASNGR